RRSRARSRGPYPANPVRVDLVDPHRRPPSAPRMARSSAMKYTPRLCLCLGTLLSALCGPAVAAERPNLIWIMADDLGYGDLGCYNQKVIMTPNLDRMAREGMRFTQFYAGATVCAPSRSVLMTGQHHGHTRVRGNAGAKNPIAQALRPEDVTVARMLQG